MSFDLLVFQALHKFARQSPLLDIVGIFFAQYLPYFIILGLVLMLFFESDWRKRLRKMALLTLTIIVANGLIVSLARFVYFRPRPPLVISVESLIPTPEVSSFPSGHAAAFFGLAAAISFFSRRWSIFLYLMAALIGLARVFVGVHWPSDIIVGAAVGIGSAYAVKILLGKFDAS